MRRIPGERRSISRDSRGFRRRQRPTDALHRAFGVIAARALPPLVELMAQIGGRLPAKRRIGCTHALALRAMTGCARGQAARRIAAMIEGLCRHSAACRSWYRVVRHRGIICGNGVLLGRGELARDPFHFGMTAPTARIGFELRRHIAAIQPSEPRRASAVAASIDAVTGEAGIGCPRIAAAHRQQFAAGGEPVRRPTFDAAASRKGSPRQQVKHAQIHRFTEPTGCGDGSGGETLIARVS